MPSPKLRPKTVRDVLTDEQRLHLLAGVGSPFESLEEARLAWLTHRDDLIAAKRPGLVPWAMVAFEGDARRFSNYQHLMQEGDPCHPLASARRAFAALTSTSRPRRSSTPGSTVDPVTWSPPSTRSTR